MSFRLLTLDQVGERDLKPDNLIDELPVRLVCDSDPEQDRAVLGRLAVLLAQLDAGEEDSDE